MHGVKILTEATGLMNVVFNKGAALSAARLAVPLPVAGCAQLTLLLSPGGIMVRFSVGDVCFTVVSSHLAAHEGKTYRERRNADMRDILRATRKASGSGWRFLGINEGRVMTVCGGWAMSG